MRLWLIFPLLHISIQGRYVIDKSVFWQQDGVARFVEKVIFDKTSHYTSGTANNYSEACCLCLHLGGIVNTDFDKGQLINNLNLSLVNEGGFIYDETDNLRKLKLKKVPDLSECLSG